MIQRDVILSEIHKRMTTVPGIGLVARNPKDHPGADDFDCIHIFEFPEKTTSVKTRGNKLPLLVKEMEVIIECFALAETEPASTKALYALLKEVKKVLYAGGNATLDGICTSILEKETSRVLRPPVGGAVAGMGLIFEVTFLDDLAVLFV